MIFLGIFVTFHCPQKRDSYTVYSATVAPDSPDTSLKLLSNSCQTIVWLVQCSVVQGG